jgi:LysR family transcriptional regulator, nitrogen assimilation regulatory protein
VDRAREELGRVRGALAGRVAIGLPPSVSRRLAVPLSREFRKRMPEAQLSISEGLSVGMQEALANGRLDIALLYNAAPTADVAMRPLLEEDLFLVQAKEKAKAAAPRDEPKAAPRAVPLKDIAHLPLVIPSRPNTMRMLVETELANLGLKPHIALEIDGVAAILELVADGVGSAILSQNAVQTSGRPQAFSMRPIGSPRLRSKLWVGVSALRPATLTQEAALALIDETAMRLMKG